MRASQILVLAIGALVAIVMIFLGLWQMQVFLDQGTNEAWERTKLDPVALSSVVSSDNTVSDGYGRPVTVTGTYLPQQQVVARDSLDVTRVVAALQLADGRVVPVVLGVPRGGEEPPTPTGSATVTGVFLASDGVPDPAPSLHPGEIDGVRLAALAQRWPQQLIPGYVTLAGSESTALGLDPAPLTLPTEDGSLRNEGYALQWWVFAAFAVVASVKVARDLGRRSAVREASATSDEVSAD